MQSIFRADCLHSINDKPGKNELLSLWLPLISSTLVCKITWTLRNIKKIIIISYNDEYELIVHTDIFNLRLFMTKLEGGFRNYSTPKVIGKLTEKPFREQVSAIV